MPTIVQHAVRDLFPHVRRTFETDVLPGTVVVALDTETELIGPGRQWPRMVCTSSCVGVADGAGRVTFGAPGVTLADKDSLRLWHWVLTDPRVLMVLHNAPFDLLVVVEFFRRMLGPAGGEQCLELVFRALETERVRDTWLRAPLLDNAKGFLLDAEQGYGLAGLAGQHGVALDKSGDSYRMRYAELADVPVVDWPEAAVTYSACDALATAVVWGNQQESAAKHKYTAAGFSRVVHPKSHRAADTAWLGGAVVNEAAQCRGALALSLCGGWGIRTDGVVVAAFKKRLEEEVAEYLQALLDQGILRGLDAAKPGSVDLKRLRDLVAEDARVRGIPVPRNAPTPAMKAKAAAAGVPVVGNIAYDGETLEQCRLPALQTFTAFNHARKLLETYVPVLERGKLHPICPRYYPLMATGRTSCRGPNLQNLPRDPGVRQGYVPRKGFVFSSCDYSVLEMRTWAEVCVAFGFPSGLQAAFREGRDPHLWLAALLLGITYDRAVEAMAGRHGEAEQKRVEDMRQLSKAANFGYPGGLGAQSFRAYARGYGVELTVGEASALKQRWLSAWPEATHYFAAISSHSNPMNQTITVTQLYSGRRRARCKFTQACNTLFQGLAADGAKEALYWVQREALLDRASELYGSHVVAFIHDELLGEHPEENAGAAAQRMAVVMKECMELWTPHIPQEVKPTLMRRWDKKAKPVFDDEGNLVPYDSAGAAYTNT